MPRRFIRLFLVLGVMLSSQVWALGLGEVRLDSALNEPLRAEIELLGATPEELANLRVALASEDTFERYGIDRPFYLQDMAFQVVRSGRADGNVIRIRTATPMTEPFLTFLIEASWSRGRLLREYTVLLDPPTFAPPAQTQVPVAVTAPQRSAPTDSGTIDRQPTAQSSVPQPAPSQPAPVRTAPLPSAPKPAPVADNTPFDTTAGGDYVVQRGDTLWGIAAAMRPDSRLSMNQTMLAIFEANPQAFQNNINVLSAGASLRMPSADDIYTIDRGAANSEVARQHSSWGNYVPPPPTPTTDPVIDDPDTRPSLTLVPPDDDPLGVGTGVDDPIYDEEPLSREDEILDRLAAIQAEEVPIEQSLIEIRDNELAALRQELADIQGVPYEPPVDDTLLDDDLDDDEVFVDDEMADDQMFPDLDDSADDEVADTTDAATTTSQSPGSILIDDSPSLVDQIIGFVKKFALFIGGIIAVVIAMLFWFMRRGRGDDEDVDSWNPLDADEVRMDPMDSTESMQAPRPDESIMVVEQESGISTLDEGTFEAPAPTFEPGMGDVGDISETADTGQFGSLEDTFSSETAVNLDQSDPIAEADFHMAYGLYDQAADLINGALQIEPDRQDLLTKLCEIYFVWGNRDAFVDAAQRLKAVTGGGDNDDWNKIVIMGQQIAGDDRLFAGAGVAGATKEVDLSFESESDNTGELDMDFGADGGGDDIIDLGADVGGGDVIDLGAGDETAAADDGVDFLFEDDATEASDLADTAEATGSEFSVTAEMPTVESNTEATVETPTIEEQFSGFDATSELPDIDESTLDSAIAGSGQTSDATAEIDLADLDLGIDGLAETELASLDELDVTGTNEILDPSSATGKNPQVDPDATGVQMAMDPASTGLSEGLGFDDDLSTTGTGLSDMRLAADETGQNPMMDAIDSDLTGANTILDETLLDATGHTQVLPEDFAVETAAEEAGDLADNEATMMASDLSDDQETVLASLDDDEADFDFAKTEALPPEVFTGNTNLDETGELPAVASTDVDLDLDDLTAALKVSEAGDTVEQPRDDATVEQPRPNVQGEDSVATMELAADDMSDDLQEARTMTEVGTKLDLARAYVDMGDPAGARSILEEVLDEGDEGQRQQAQQLLDSLPS